MSKDIRSFFSTGSVNSPRISQTNQNLNASDANKSQKPNSRKRKGKPAGALEEYDPNENDAMSIDDDDFIERPPPHQRPHRSSQARTRILIDSDQEEDQVSVVVPLKIPRVNKTLAKRELEPLVDPSAYFDPAQLSNARLPPLKKSRTAKKSTSKNDNRQDTHEEDRSSSLDTTRAIVDSDFEPDVKPEICNDRQDKDGTEKRSAASRNHKDASNSQNLKDNVNIHKSLKSEHAQSNSPRQAASKTNDEPKVDLAAVVPPQPLPMKLEAHQTHDNEDLLALGRKSTAKRQKLAPAASTEIASPKQSKLPNDSAENTTRKPSFAPRENYGKALDPGAKEIPEAAENCLAGLTFVFTGDLVGLGRDEATDIIKRYAGRVTSAVSGKTSYLIVGQDAGKTKIEKAKSVGTKTLTEDEFLDLLRSKPAVSDEAVNATKSKRQLDQEKQTADINVAQIACEADSAMWVDKYKPSKPGEIIGNKTNVDRLSQWLSEFPKSRANRFKFTGEKNTTHFRAALLSGPPGIGKTTSAHVVARSLGYHIIEYNASDLRSKRSLDDFAAQIMSNCTLGGMNGGSVANSKHVLIMDEVDGMSGSDRGGLAELTVLIKKSRVPVICVCNDRTDPKLRTLAACCLDLRYRRPEAQHVRARLMRICFLEKFQIQGPALDAIYASTHGDIRQTIHLLSTYRLSKNTIDYDQAKELAQAAGKDMEVGIFDATRHFLSSSEFKRRSMSESLEQFFTDYDMVPLLVQENYLKVRVSNDPTKSLQLLAKAAADIAEGNHIEKAIRSGQQWGLLNAYGIFSTIAPATALSQGSFSNVVEGDSQGYNRGGGGMYQFTSVLGNMSRLGKSERLLAELEMHMARGTHSCIGRKGARLDYLPALASMIARDISASSNMPKNEDAIDPVRRVIDMMDAYYLDRDDVDSIFELNVGAAAEAFKNIPAVAKTKFTREYNRESHPVAMFQLPKSTRPGKGSAGELSSGLDKEAEDEAAEEVEDKDNEDDEEALRKQLSKIAGKGKSKARGGATSARGRKKK